MNIDAEALLKQHEEAEGLEKWHVPFPMGVFGTLRIDWGNTDLMGRPKGTRKEDWEGDDYWGRDLNYAYESHHRAFLPHWLARGLSIHHSTGSSGVFEIFTYTPENWKKMIVGVDRLEGFRPRIREEEEDSWRREYSYHRSLDSYYRTLVWLRVLPDDYDHPYFDGRHYDDPRDLKIPVDQWEDYPRVPCWVYASMRENKANLELADSPIIWCGDLPASAEAKEPAKEPA